MTLTKLPPEVWDNLEIAVDTTLVFVNRNSEDCLAQCLERLAYLDDTDD